MDDKLQDILDNLPEKPPLSRLEPFREFIDELRRRGRTYREIASILAEKCQVRVSVSTIHDFVRVRATREPVKRPMTPAARINPVMNAPKEERPQIDEVQRRIAALKRQSAPAKASPKQFQYDPDEPLHLPAKARKG